MLVKLLKHDVKAFVILECLVDFDDLRVVEGGEDEELLQEVGGTLHVLFLDAFDCSRRVGVLLHFGPVNYSERPPAH